MLASIFIVCVKYTFKLIPRYSVVAEYVSYPIEQLMNEIFITFEWKRGAVSVKPVQLRSSLSRVSLSTLSLLGNSPVPFPKIGRAHLLALRTPSSAFSPLLIVQFVAVVVL